MHSWLQLRIQVDETQVDAISEYLSEAGGQAGRYKDAKDQPIFEPELGTIPLWKQTIITALFEKNTDINLIAQNVKQHFSINPQHIHIENLKDRDWEREWLTHFRP